MATTLHEVLGQSLGNSSDLFALLLAAKDRDVLHVDEAHELAKPMQTALYLALDKKRIVLGSKNGKCPQTLPLADFTLLLSSTDEYGLLQPLRDRCRLLLRFDYYEVQDLTTILHHRIRALGWDTIVAMLWLQPPSCPLCPLRVHAVVVLMVRRAHVN